MNYENILRFWYCMEHIVPFFPKKAEQLKKEIKDIKETFGQEKIAQTTIYLGKIEVKNLYDILEEKGIIIPEDRVEFETGHTIIALLDLDSDGKYIDGTFKIGRFFYTVSKIFSNSESDGMNLEAILEFDKTYNDKIIGRNFSQVTELLRLSSELVAKLYSNQPDQLKQREIENIFINQNKSQNNQNIDPMLDSFYALDLKKIIDSNLAEDHWLSQLIVSLVNQRNDTRIRIDNNPEFLKEITSPNVQSIGKWPSRYSPSLMQQVAINIAIAKKAPKVFSVNGPPGTGKTTLLKEIIVENIIQRAIKLIDLNPKNCFERCNLESPPNKYTQTYYKIPESIKQYGIIVASNNNAAVENISKDLPISTELYNEKTHTELFDVNKQDIKDTYFADVASTILGEDVENLTAWGLISCALGNSTNINVIKDILNITQKDGILMKYFYTADLKPDWEGAVKEFKKIYRQTIKKRKEITKEINLIAILEQRLNMDFTQINNEINGVKEKILQFEHNLNKLQIEIKFLKDEKVILENGIQNLLSSISLFDKIKSILMKVVKIENLKKTQSEYSNLTIKLLELDKENLLTLKKKNQKENELSNIEEELNQAKKEFDKTQSQLDKIKQKYGDNYAANNFFTNITANEKSQKTSPWTNIEHDKLREELFYSALMVHKAFILNSTQLKQNLNMLHAYWAKEPFKSGDTEKFVKEAFATLNILIPVLSTTFAAVKSMCRDIPAEALGLLIIDEAGQATPASAIGALWRSNRAIIVGDPLQVEPVVTSATTLKYKLGEYYKVDPQYLQNEISIQVLADKYNPYWGEINRIEVGCPLVVHRRCISPMFDISNQISYGGRMFNATFSKDKNFALLKSCFIDIKGKEKGNKNHYVAEQGDAVLKIIQDAYEVYNDDLFEHKKNILFVISPFTTVATEIRRIIRTKFGEKVNNEWLKNCVGTVHTFQGKGADEVILVLGCDSNSGAGAANWVASKANILNVAVSRAKNRLAIIGDKDLWNKLNYFKNAITLLDK